jgi:hypothetical protein
MVDYAGRLERRCGGLVILELLRGKIGEILRGQGFRGQCELPCCMFQCFTSSTNVEVLPREGFRAPAARYLPQSAITDTVHFRVRSWLFSLNNKLKVCDTPTFAAPALGLSQPPHTPPVKFTDINQTHASRRPRPPHFISSPCNLMQIGSE